MKQTTGENAVWQPKTRRILTAIFVCWFLFNAFLLAEHEFWRDEANVWLFARDVGLGELFREIKYQGHPCLWYLLVMPFARLGFPFQTIGALSLWVMTAAAAIFTYKSPFHPLTKAVCLFSPIFTYYYAVVARNYCLIALLLLLLAYFYERRNKKSVLYGLLLGLLVQADSIALAPAGLISLMWLWESIRESLRQKSKRPFAEAAGGLWIPLASLLLWILEFYQVSDSSEFQLRSLGLSETLAEIKGFSLHIVNRMTGMEGKKLLLFLLLLAGVCIWLSVKKRNFWFSAVLLGFFFFEVIFSVFVYQLHIWHYIALCFGLIWFFWLCFPDLHEKKGEGIGLVKGSVRSRKLRAGMPYLLAEILLAALGIAMFIRWNSPEEGSSLSNAINGLYSDGVHAAEYIRENLEKDSLFLVTNVSEAATVQAYLDRDYTFYYAGSGQAVTYANYNADQDVSISYEALLSWMKNTFPQADSFYLLLCPDNCIEDIPDQEREKWRLLYETTEETARGEYYRLYEIQML